jgi:hypothetical protein
MHFDVAERGNIDSNALRDEMKKAGLLRHVAA